MCGIAGIATLDPEKISVRNFLLHATKKLRHRGPDDEGFFVAHENNNTACFSGDDTPSEVTESKFCFSPDKHLSQDKSSFSLGFCHRRL